MTTPDEGTRDRQTHFNCLRMERSNNPPYRKSRGSCFREKIFRFQDSNMVFKTVFKTVHL